MKVEETKHIANPKNGYRGFDYTENKKVPASAKRFRVAYLFYWKWDWVSWKKISPKIETYHTHKKTLEECIKHLNHILDNDPHHNEYCIPFIVDKDLDIWIEKKDKDGKWSRYDDWKFNEEKEAA